MTVLILAGTGDARQLAQFCADHNIAACASLAGATRQPKQLAVPTYHGSFGGGDGFRAFLKRHKIRAVLDATHPFAHQITRRSHDIAREMGLPYMRFERPAWQPGPGDHWISLHDESEAAAHIAPDAVVFLATGRQSLPKFANLGHAQLICRQIDPPEGAFPWPNGAYLIGRPPFSMADEEALFRRLSVDVLVVKNAGYSALFAKNGYDIDAFNSGVTVLFPELDERAEVPEITTACWGILDKDPKSLMCASSRMVVKRKGAARPAVLACTLLAYAPEFELGTTLQEAEQDVALNHPHCAKFCVLGGASCSA